MLVSVLRGGNLLVRSDPGAHEHLLERPGARQATMGADRSMGAGWIEVDAAALGTEEELRSWLTVALDHHRSRS